MRVAIVAEPFVAIPPKQYGGIEQVIYHLIKGLKEMGHKPILLGPGDSEVDCELIPICDKALMFPASKSKKDLDAHARLVKKARDVTRKKLLEILPDIDIIHSHSFDLKDFAEFPNLTTIHNKIFLSDPYYLLNLNYYLDRKELFWTSVSKNQQEVCPELNFVATVYNGEDPHDFPIISEPEDYLCFLGRFDRDKAPHMAIQLAINLGKKIKLAGKLDHDSQGYFDEEIKPYLKNPLVEYLGEVNFEQKVKLVGNALCNLHPTNFREPFGLTVLEAAYCGTPTLAIARGSMPELIEDGRTGVLVEDFIEGRYRIEECYRLDRRYIASRARQLFNYRTMTEQYLDAYRTVLEHFPVRRTPRNAFQRALRYAAHQVRGLHEPTLPAGSSSPGRPHLTRHRK
jgi:glycosyltransferase involved in cell wall biosynthesis